MPTWEESYGTDVVTTLKCEIMFCCSKESRDYIILNIFFKTAKKQMCLHIARPLTSYFLFCFSQYFFQCFSCWKVLFSYLSPVVIYYYKKKKHIITHLFQFPPYSSPLSLMSHLDNNFEPGEPIIGNHIAVLCKNPNPCRTKYFLGPFFP